MNNIIEFQPVGKRVNLNPGGSLLDAARSASVGLASVCGGAGTCGECKIKLISGDLTPPTLLEQTTFGPDALSDGWRLACQAVALTDIKLYIPIESITTPQRLQVDGEGIKYSLDPIIKTPNSFGLAVDLGTTKIAAFLVNLNTGETVAKDGIMNPQIAYGEDVISRLAYTEQEPLGAKKLQTILFDSLNDILAALCAKGNILPDQVLDVVMVGNTAMHHLAAGLPVTQLGHAPFLPALNSSISLPAHSIGLRTSPSSQVYFPPVIAGYVGADHLAMLLAINSDSIGFLPTQAKLSNENNLRLHKKRRDKKERKVLAVDIGTNTEISLIIGSKIISCSCASGPAFEGAHIKEGMRAAPGAIERAAWKGGKLIWQTIESQTPIGICGSGILDIISSLLEGKIIKPSGQLSTGKEFLIVSKFESGLDRNLVITRKDIHEIQLAKSAIRSGIDILLENSGLRAEDLDEILVAGAFGTYLNSTNAMKIGMFPIIPGERIHQIGNAAGAGARQLLLSLKARESAEIIARKIRYLDLATNKGFMNTFVKNLVL